MESAGYRIDQSVISGGGRPASSAGYSLHVTVGQSTPLADPDEPPTSANYALKPGFWSTLAGTGNSCTADFGGDGDVDGQDLASLAGGTFILPYADFAGQFGRLCE